MLLDRLGQYLRGSQGVGTGQPVVGDEDALGGAHRERLANGLHGLRGAHRHDGDLTAAGGRELKSGLHAELVAGIQYAGHTFTLEALAVELGIHIGIGDLLHGHDDVHQQLLVSQDGALATPCYRDRRDSRVPREPRASLVGR